MLGEIGECTFTPHGHNIIHMLTSSNMASSSISANSLMPGFNRAVHRDSVPGKVNFRPDTAAATSTLLFKTRGSNS